MSRVTVVTAARNAAAFLPEAIASVQAQTCQDWSYVIVDDASTDDTAAVADAAASKDRRIQVLRLDESKGAYAAANLAMLQAESPYLARLDADDTARPDRLERQLALLSAEPATRACAAGWEIIGEQRRDTRRSVPSHDNGVIKWMMWFRSNLLHSTLLIDTAYFLDMGGYGPERIGEDFRLWGRIVRDGVLAVDDEALVRYRVSDGQMTKAEGVRDQPERLRITLDHMQHCAPHTAWTLDDARDLRWIGSGAGCAPERGLALLDRFEAAWRADDALSDAARDALTTMTATRRLRHLRRCVGNYRSQVPLAAARHPVAVGKALLRSGRNRGNQWP